MHLKCWFPSKALGWELGLFTDLGNGNVSVNGRDGKRTFSKSEIHRYDPTHDIDHEDMCSMNHLHEGPLLDNLRRRFFANKIYTTTGDVLISVNPYLKIPGLYENIVAYLDIAEDGGDLERAATKPHVYKIANDALVEMLYGKRSLHENSIARNQSVVVSGESGAGKTEASKHVMNFLIAADRERKDDADKQAGAALGDAIRKVLLESNVIFEAFGNSKTVRNDNSSRFGKYIKLQYSADNHLISAYSETFLLEKSRLMNIGLGERNYHVFYQFLRGEHDPALVSKLKLRDPSEFKMLLDSTGTALPSDMDPLYGELKVALATLGCSQEEISHLWTLVAAILHMGNLSVTMLGDSSVESSDAPLSTDVGHVRIASSTASLQELADMLGLVSEMFVSRLSTQRVKVGNRRSVTIKRLNAIDINNNISALIKWIYSSVFAWLVKKINFAHCSVASADAVATKFTGILDIFGFEILQSNSFEQLCINFTNERLQQQFNEYVFDREQNIYRAEGLEWDSIQYKDNQPVIDLIGKKPSGLLIILEGQGMLNRGAADEGALLSAFNTAHDQKHPAYVKSRFGTDGKFTVKHFAGDVTYLVTGFMEKNNDSLQEDLMELMLCSTNSFIQNAIVTIGTGSTGIPGEPGYVPEIDAGKIVASAGNLSMSATRPSSMAVSGEDLKKAGVRSSATGASGAEGGKKMASTVTVSYQFRSQLDVLLLNLRSTSPHYIKCVKPNSSKTPGIFDADMVLEQLRYSGALEVVRIRQEGFPISLTFMEFYETFARLGFRDGWKKPNACTPEQAKEYTTILCSEHLAAKKGFQLGLTKVFMKSDCYERMHLAINDFLGKIVRRIQALVRKRRHTKRYLTLRRGIVPLQALLRMFVLRRRFKRKMAELFEARERERLRLIEERRQADLERTHRVDGLHNAAIAGDLETVRSLLTAHPEDYYLRNEQHQDRTVLHEAAASGHLALVQYLNPSRDDIFAKDRLGNNAVHYALQTGKRVSLDILRYFAVVNASDQESLNGVLAGLQKLGITPRPAHDSLPTPPPTAPKRAVDPALVGVRPPPAPVLDEEDAAVLLSSAVQQSEENAGKSGELKSGWMSKRGEGSSWRKRWVVLTTDALMYFRNNKDKVPRDTLSFANRNDIIIQRTPDKATAIDIFINHQSVKKKRDRVSLMADTEADMQAWMNLLKAAAGVECQPLRCAASGVSGLVSASAHTAKPLVVLRPAWTSLLLRSVNNARETPLHLVAQFDVVAAQKSANPDIADPSQQLWTLNDTLEVASWMVGNLAPLHVFNSRGLTPLQLAVQLGHEALASLLTKHGADPMKSMYGTAGQRTSYDLAAHSQQFHALLQQASKVFAQRNGSFLPMPARLRGFHYFSIGFYKGVSS